MVTKVRGQFTDFTGTAHVDTAEPGRLLGRSPSTPPASTPATRDRDGHLRSGDFFDDRAVPRDHLRLHRRRPRRRRLDHHRRPDHQGHHQAGHHRLRVHRLGPGPVRQRPHRLRGRDHDQPQGLGPDLERRARDRRRARLRQGQARVRRLGDQERLTHDRSSPARGRPGMRRPRRRCAVRYRPVTTMPARGPDRPARSTMDDAHAVVEVMAAAAARTTSARSPSRRPTSSATGSGPASTSRTSTVGVFDGDAHGRLRRGHGGHDRGDAAVHPDHRGRGIGTGLARWMQEHRRRARRHGGRHAGAAGLRRRPAARGARLPRALGELGPRAADGRRDRRARRCPRGTRSARPTRRSTARCRTCWRTPSSSGPSASGEPYEDLRSRA